MSVFLPCTSNRTAAHIEIVQIIGPTKHQIIHGHIGIITMQSDLLLHGELDLDTLGVRLSPDEPGIDQADLKVNK
jgi:hypothetical protein